MQQHIGIAVADHLPVVGNIDSTQSQRSTVPKPVSVVANPDP
jgi:hypothetical protein